MTMMMTDRQTDGRTDKRIEGWTDRPTVEIKRIEVDTCLYRAEVKVKVAYSC